LELKQFDNNDGKMLESYAVKIGNSNDIVFSLRNISDKYNLNLNIPQSAEKIKDKFHKMFKLGEETDEETDIIEALIALYFIENDGKDDFLIDKNISNSVLDCLIDDKSVLFEIEKEMEEIVFLNILATEEYSDGIIGVLQDEDNE